MLVCARVCVCVRACVRECAWVLNCICARAYVRRVVDVPACDSVDYCTLCVDFAGD